MQVNLSTDIAFLETGRNPYGQALSVLTISGAFEDVITSSILAQARNVDKKPIHKRRWRDQAILHSRELINTKAWWIEVRDGIWLPPPGREFTILQRGKPRLIRCPHPIVAVVDKAIARTIALILSDLISPNVYGRPGPGGRDALAAVADALDFHLLHPGQVYTYQTDIQGAFQAANLVTAYSSMEHLLRLTGTVIHPDLRETHHRLLTAGSGDHVGPWVDPGSGLQTGAGSSPLLMCCHLHDTDHGMDDLADQDGSRYARYADDLIYQTTDPDAVKRAQRMATQQVERLGMTLRPDKTTTATPTDTHYDYLGYRLITSPTVTLTVPPDIRDDWTSRVARWTRTKNEDTTCKVAGWLRYYRLAVDLNPQLPLHLDQETDRKLSQRRRCCIHQETWERITGEETTEI